MSTKHIFITTIYICIFTKQNIIILNMRLTTYPIYWFSLRENKDWLKQSHKYYV